MKGWEEREGEIKESSLYISNWRSFLLGDIIRRIACSLFRELLFWK